MAPLSEARDTPVTRWTKVLNLHVLPAIGDEVFADPNFEPVEVLDIGWNLSPGAGRPVFQVVLGVLDADEVGGLDDAAALLTANGWGQESGGA